MLRSDTTVGSISWIKIETLNSIYCLSINGEKKIQVVSADKDRSLYLEDHMSSPEKLQDKIALGMSAFVKGDYKDSIVTFSEIIDQEPTHRLAMTTRGSAYLKLAHLEAAIADFDRVINHHPDYAKAYHLRGLAREQRGDEDRAIGDFTRAIELDPEYGAAYYSRATLHTKMGQEDLASEDIQMVTHLSNKNIETFANQTSGLRSQHMQIEAALESELNR